MADTAQPNEHGSTAWARHPGDRLWHAVSVVVFDGSTVTHCRGRWPTSDDGVEWSNRPPHEERCDACTAALIELGMIERGLRELRQHADDVDHDHDLGGEGG